MLTDKQIEVAVNWWAEAIQNPSKDNGDNGMISVFATMLVKRIEPKNIERFKESLANLLKSDQDERVYLESDYLPYGKLGDAFYLGNIPIENAPFKTQMTFLNGGVQVKCGYAQPFKELMQITKDDPM